MPIGATNERHSTGDWSLESKCMHGAESIRTVNDVSSSSQRLCERGQLFSAAAEERLRRSLVWWGFCLLWLGGTWPYQAILQAQQYYARSMPGLGFFVLITFTWPLLGAHLVQARARGRVSVSQTLTLILTLATSCRCSVAPPRRPASHRASTPPSCSPAASASHSSRRSLSLTLEPEP